MATRLFAVRRRDCPAVAGGIKQRMSCRGNTARSTQASRWHYGLSLTVLAACLGCNAGITWIVLDKLKYALISRALETGGTMTPSGLLSAGLAALGAIDIVLLAAFASFAAAIIWLERRERAFTRLLSEPGGGIVAAGAVMVAWLGHSYLGRGYLLSGDTIAHVAMLTSQVQAITDGQNPYWTNFSYFGLPLSEYYSPTTFWGLAAIDLAIGDPSLSLRLFFLVTYLLSAVAMVFLARQLGLARIGALIACMTYAGSFAHLHLLLYRGAVPQALSMVLLPLVLLFLHRLLTNRRPAAIADWFGLVLSAAGLAANYVPLAIVAFPYVGLFGLGVASIRRPGWGRWAAVAAAGAATALLAAFVLLPAATSHSEVRLLNVGEWIYFELPTLDYFNHLLVWRAWRSNEGGGAAYLGLSVVALAGYALWCTIGRRQALQGRGSSLRSVTLGLGVLFVVSFFLKGAHVRDVVFTLLFMSLLAGIGGEQLLRSGWLGRSGAAILVGVVLLDLGSTAMQSVGRSDKGYLDAAGDYLERETPPTRTLQGFVEGKELVIGGTGILAWHGVELVNAGHAELATPAWILGDIAETLVQEDLNRDGRLSASTNTLLCLLRVGRVVIDERTHMGVPDSIPAVEEGPLGRVVKTHCDYQVVFATRLAQMNGPRIDPVMLYNSDHSAHLLPAFHEFFGRYRALLQLDPTDGIAAAIPVIAVVGEPPSAGGPAPDVSPKVTVESYTVSAAQVAVDIVVDHPGFVRLSHAAHRSLRIYRNDAEVATYEDPMGFIVVPVVEGENRLEIIPGTLPVQRLANIVSGVTLTMLVCALLFWRLGARRSFLRWQPSDYAKGPVRSASRSVRYPRLANKDGH